jgi:DNA modification methylase
MGKKKSDIVIDCAYDKLVPVSELKPNQENPNTHTEEQIKLTAAIIKATKWRYAITVSNQSGMIVDGHCRYEAGLLIGDIKVPVDYQDFDSYEDEKAEMIRKNKLEELSEFSGLKLADILVDLDQANYDLSLTALTQEEIEDIVIGPLEGNPEDDIVPEPPKKAKTKTGDLIILGSHRLLCGDCTVSANVERLMGQEKVDMVFTDPPYGIDYEDIKHHHRKINGDKKSETSYLLAAIPNQCPRYICCNWMSYSHFYNFVPDMKALIVWDKIVRIQNLDKFYKQHEFIIYEGPFGGEQTLDGDVWQIKRETMKEHPTAKPVELIVRAIIYSSQVKDIVYDGFLGSGSTLIACEKLNRRCFGMEIDPIYCDVIIERWEKFTGKKVKRSKKVA